MHKIAFFDKFLSCFAIYKNSHPEYNKKQLRCSAAKKEKSKWTNRQSMERNQLLRKTNRQS